MIGAFSTAVDLISAANKLSEVSDDDITSTIKELNATKSITERAKKSLFVYPVLYSPGVTDLTVASKISKFLEIQYGIFTMLTVGLTPSVEDGNIGAYLNSISTEGYEGLEDYKGKDVTFSIIDTGNKDISMALESASPEDIDSWSLEFSSESKEFDTEYVYSMEKHRQQSPKNTHIPDKDNNGNKPVILKPDTNPNSSAKKNSNNDEKEEKFLDSDPVDFEGDARAAIEANKTFDKLKSGHPTIINLKLKLKGYQDSFVVPIAIKSNPHFVKEEDLVALFDSALEDKRLLTRIVKLTSGEISFFKDFMFNMDRIKRDERMYQKFGQHPWYQQFIQRKEMNALKRLGLIIGNFFTPLKKFILGTSNFLPTASIIMNVSEIEHSTKMKYGFLMKNEKILVGLLKSLGLLCIGIYDPTIEAVNFYFNGFKKPMFVTLKEMKSDKEDATTEMAKVMNTMLKRGIM